LDLAKQNSSGGRWCAGLSLGANTTQLNIAAGTLSADSYYRFALTFEKGSRSSQTVTIIHTLVRSAPRIRISGPVGEFASTSKLSLTAEVDAADATLLWSMGDGSTALDLRSSGVLLTSINARTLVLRSRALSPLGHYVFRLVARLQYGGSEEVSSSAEYVVDVSAMPCCGSCAVSPQNGTALETVFRVECAGFEIGPQPVQFQFSLEGSRGDTGRRFLRAAAVDLSSLETTLPEGSPPTYALRVIGTVVGPSGQKLDYPISVVVRPPYSISSSLSSAEAMQQRVSLSQNVTNSHLRDAVQMADPEKIVQSILLVTSMLDVSVTVAAGPSSNATADRSSCEARCAHGTCQRDERGSALCMCESGWMGTYCDLSGSLLRAKQQLRAAALDALSSASNCSAAMGADEVQSQVEALHSVIVESSEVSGSAATQAGTLLERFVAL